MQNQSQWPYPANQPGQGGPSAPPPQQSHFAHQQQSLSAPHLPPHAYDGPGTHHPVYTAPSTSGPHPPGPLRPLHSHPHHQYQPDPLPPHPAQPYFHQQHPAPPQGHQIPSRSRTTSIPGPSSGSGQYAGAATDVGTSRRESAGQAPGSVKAAGLSMSSAAIAAAASMDKSKRSRSRLSCAECRRLKLKCSRIWPCDQCLKRDRAHLCPDQELDEVSRARTREAKELLSLRERQKVLEAIIRENGLADALPEDARKDDDEFGDAELDEGRAAEKESRKGTLAKDGTGDISHYYGTNAQSIWINDDGDLSDEGASEFEDGLSPLSSDRPARHFSSRSASQSRSPHAALECNVYDRNDPPDLSFTSRPTPSIGDIARLGGSAYNLKDTGPSFDSTQTSPETNCLLGGRRLSIEELQSSLPSLDRAKHLFELFFDIATWGFSPLSREAAYRWYLHVVYNCHPTTCAPSSALGQKFAVVYLILSNGCLWDTSFTPTPEKITSDECDRYFRAAELCFSNSDLAVHPSPSVVIACVLFALFYHNAKPDGAAAVWPLFGIGIRTALAAGMHRDGKAWKLPQNEVDFRARAFWELVSLDRLQAVMWGRPYTLRSSHIDTPYPTLQSDLARLEPAFMFDSTEHCTKILIDPDTKPPNCMGAIDIAPPDKKVEPWLYDFFKWKWDFTQTTCERIFDEVFSVKPPTYQVVLNIDAALREVNLRAPVSIKSHVLSASSVWGRGGASSNEVGDLRAQSKCFAIACAAFTMNENLLFVHRPFFVRALQMYQHDPLQSPWQRSVQVIIRELSPNIITVANDMLSRFPVIGARYWFPIWATFNAASPLTAFLLKCPGSAYAVDAAKTLSRAVEVLELGASIGSIKAVQLLPAFRKQVDRALARLARYQNGDPQSELFLTSTGIDQDLASLGEWSALVRRKQPHDRDRSPSDDQSRRAGSTSGSQQPVARPSPRDAPSGFASDAAGQRITHAPPPAPSSFALQSPSMVVPVRAESIASAEGQVAASYQHQQPYNTASDADRQRSDHPMSHIHPSFPAQDSWHLPDSGREQQASFPRNESQSAWPSSDTSLSTHPGGLPYIHWGMPPMSAAPTHVSQPQDVHYPTTPDPDTYITQNYGFHAGPGFDLSHLPAASTTDDGRAAAWAWQGQSGRGDHTY